MNKDLFNFVGKYVEVELHRKRYPTDDHVKIFCGRLTDIGHSNICLFIDGKHRWIPKPVFFRDKIKEVD